MNRQHSLSIVIPVYNERRLLAASVKEIGGYLSRHVGEFEILVVESGSSDGSAEICDQLASGNKDIRVIHERSRNGFGAAVRLGFRHSKMELVLVLTVDLPYPLETISAGLDSIPSYDCVLSYRASDKRKGFRRFQSDVYNILVKAVLGLPMRHVNSAFKLLRRDFVESLSLRSDGWFFDAELLYWIARNKLCYLELPVPLVDRTRGTSSVNYFAFCSIIRELIAFLARERRS